MKEPNHNNLFAINILTIIKKQTSKQTIKHQGCRKTFTNLKSRVTNGSQKVLSREYQNLKIEKQYIEDEQRMKCKGKQKTEMEERRSYQREEKKQETHAGEST